MLIPKPVFGLHKIADANSSRYAMGGVQFSRDRNGDPVAVATDGRKLVAFGWKEPAADDYPTGAFTEGEPLNLAHEPDFTAIVPIDACKAQQKFRVKVAVAKVKPILEQVAIQEVGANGAVTIAQTDLDRKAKDEFKLLEGRYPDWRGAVPRLEGPESFHYEVDPKILADVLNTIADFTSDDEHKAVTLSFNTGPNGTKAAMTVSVVRPDGRKAVAVVMPLCSDAHKSPAQAWRPEGARPAVKPAKAVKAAA